jgi:hypothetical protein
MISIMIRTEINVMPKPIPICAERVGGDSPKEKSFVYSVKKKCHFLPVIAVTVIVVTALVVLTFCVV